MIENSDRSICRTDDEATWPPLPAVILGLDPRIHGHGTPRLKHRRGEPPHAHLDHTAAAMAARTACSSMSCRPMTTRRVPRVSPGVQARSK